MMRLRKFGEPTPALLAKARYENPRRCSLSAAYKDVTVDGTTVYVDEVVNDGSCSDIEDTIEANMKESGQLDR